jgi:hypothetical protein
MSAHFGMTSDYAGAGPHVFGPTIFERVVAAAKGEVTYPVGSLTLRDVVVYISEVANADRTGREAAIRAMYADARDEDRSIAEMGFEDFLRSLEGEASS